MNVDHGIRRHRLDERSFQEGNHGRQWRAICARWKAFFLLGLALLPTQAARAELPAAESWRVWLEPRFMHQPVTAPVAEAERTDLAGGWLQAGALEPLTKVEWKQMGISWETFLAQARTNAAADLAGLKPVYVRNRRKTIEYAELRSESGRMASAVLAPGLAALFAETLGPDLLLVVPNQNTAFVFSKLASNYRDYAPMVLRAYRAGAHPVSLEVLALSAQGMQAVGAYEESGR